MQHNRQLWAYVSHVPVCAQHWGLQDAQKATLHLPPSFVLILCRTGPNGLVCSGPEAGECVCGQCRCRQEVNPEVSLDCIIQITLSIITQPH